MIIQIENPIYEITKLLNDEESDDFQKGIEKLFERYDEVLRKLADR
jgi:hypothetical protein